MNRFFYALYQAVKHATVLKQQAKSSVNSLSSLPIEVWQQQGIRAVVFDFDGVLACHGEPVPNSAGKRALDRALSSFPAHVFILSNKPSLERKQYFEKHYPEIQFVIAKKKPYPDGLLRIAELMHLSPSEIVLVDDRLLTGGLATVIANGQFCYFSKAETNFAKQPLTESFWACLRYLERIIFL